MDESKKSETFTLETPDPDRYWSGPVPLSSGNLGEQLRESDRATNRQQSQAWALAVVMVLAVSMLVLVTQVV